MLAPTCSSQPTPASASERVDMVARIPWSISFSGADRRSTSRSAGAALSRCSWGVRSISSRLPNRECRSQSSS